MKLNFEDKIKIIELYRDGVPGYNIKLKYNINKSTLSRITRQYNEYGIESFIHKRHNQKYSIEFKMEVVNRILIGESILSVATELMINDGTLHSWLKKYKELGYNGLKDKIKGRPCKMKKTNNQTNIKEISNQDKRIKELEERNAQLEMELDLLKKLKALVQQREQQQDKKK